MYVCMYVCEYVCACMYVCMYVCIYVGMYEWNYVFSYSILLLMIIFLYLVQSFNTYILSYSATVAKLQLKRKRKDPAVIDSDVSFTCWSWSCNYFIMLNYLYCLNYLSRDDRCYLLTNFELQTPHTKTCTYTRIRTHTCIYEKTCVLTVDNITNYHARTRTYTYTHTHRRNPILYR